MWRKGGSAGSQQRHAAATVAAHPLAHDGAAMHPPTHPPPHSLQDATSALKTACSSSVGPRTAALPLYARSATSPQARAKPQRAELLPREISGVPLAGLKSRMISPAAAP